MENLLSIAWRNTKTKRSPLRKVLVAAIAVKLGIATGLSLVLPLGGLKVWITTGFDRV